MGFIQTGKDIGKTLKNANRFREVLSVFARNGFDELIGRTNLPDKFSGFVLPRAKYKPDENLDMWGSFGYRLRISFEQLGPGFIKIGQIIASREDVFESSFVEQLKPLLDQGSPIDFLDAKAIIERTLEKKLEDVFETFEEQPIATASIGCVYEGVLKSGEQVVVKVRKPKIREVIEVDFELFKFLIQRLEGISEEFKYLGLSRVIDDFHKTVLLELDFNLEKSNLERLKENISKADTKNIIYIPKVYNDFSSERVLVLEKLKGTPFSQLTQESITDEVRETLLESIHLFVNSILSDGFFHADLHGGNFFLLDDGKIGLIDFGSVGHLSSKNKASLVSILYALSRNDFEHLVYEFLDIAEYEKIPNHQVLARDLQESIAPLVGLSSQEMDPKVFLNQFVQTLMKHQMYLPREWYIIFRAIMALDGVGRSMGIDVKAFEILGEDSAKLIKQMFSKDQLVEEGFWFGRDLLNTMRIVPRHLSWFLKEVSKNNYAIEIRDEGVARNLHFIGKALIFLGGMILVSSLVLVAAVFYLRNSLKLIPHSSAFIMLASIVFGIIFVLIYYVKKRD